MQDTENQQPAHATAVLRESVRLSGINSVKASIGPAKNLNKRPSWLGRMVHAVSQLFTRDKSKQVLLNTLQLIEPKPLVFKSNSVSTFITPLSIYAGKPVAHNIRASAIEEFHRMKSSSGATIN